jgi:O-antigen ligase
LVALVGLVVYFVAGNEGLLERMQAGADRVSTGAQILAAREDTANVGLASREYWKNQGLKGWTRNPVLGYGVEAFRADYGVTSHSTPIDLLYNQGIIGLSLFYAMFFSLAWRVWRVRGNAMRGFQVLAIAGLACYLFMSLSETLYYDPFVAAFIAIGVGTLTRGAVRAVEPGRTYAGRPRPAARAPT